MGKSVKLTAKIQQAITKFKKGKVGKISKAAFKVELAAFLKKTDKRIAFRHLEQWVEESDNAWIMDKTKTAPRSHGMATRLQSQIADAPSQPRTKVGKTTKVDESSSSDSSSNENSDSDSDSTVTSSTDEDVIIAMPSTVTVRKNGKKSCVKKLSVKNKNETIAPRDSVENHSETNNSTTSMGNFPVVEGLTDLIIGNNPDPNMRRRFLSGDEVHDFFEQIGLRPLGNSLPVDQGSSQARNSGQIGRNHYLQCGNNGGIRQMSSASTMTMPPCTLPPISYFFPMNAPSNEPRPESPPVNFEEILRVLADRAKKVVVPVQPTASRSCQTPAPRVEENRNDPDNIGTNAAIKYPGNAKKRIPEVLSSLNNVVNVLYDSNRAMQVCGRRVQIQEIKTAEGLFRAYTRELRDLTKTINDANMTGVKPEDDSIQIDDDTE